MAVACALPAAAGTGKNGKPVAAKQAALEAIPVGDPVGDPVAGKLKIDSERCQECHSSTQTGNHSGLFNRGADGSGSQMSYPNELPKRFALAAP